MPDSQQSASAAKSDSPGIPRLGELTPPTSAPERSETVSGKEPGSAQLSVQGEQFAPFISLVHSYLVSMVNLADQKAAFVFATESAFLGYLLSAGLLKEMDVPVTAWHLPHWFALTTLVLLGLSIGAVLSVVTPRLGGKATGLVYSEQLPLARMAGSTPETLCHRLTQPSASHLPSTPTNSRESRLANTRPYV